MLDTLPVVLITFVSSFLMPGDANCLVRSFRNVEIDWMNVVFNYVCVEALHMEFFAVVDSICRAKAFYINSKKTYSVSDERRAILMCVAINQRKYSDLRETILDCPRLFHHDSTRTLATKGLTIALLMAGDSSSAVIHLCLHAQRMRLKLLRDARHRDNLYSEIWLESANRSRPMSWEKI